MLRCSRIGAAQQRARAFVVGPRTGTKFDFDALELFGPHAYDCLSVAEHHALFRHFGLDGQDAWSMKELAVAMSCTRAEARDLVGGAIAKLRVQLLRE